MEFTINKRIKQIAVKKLKIVKKKCIMKIVQIII